MQALRRLQTIFAVLVQNNDAEYINEDREVSKEVEAIIDQEPGVRKQSEKTVGKANIPLDEKEEIKSFVEKAEVNEELAYKRANKEREQKKEQRIKNEKQRVRED